MEVDPVVDSAEEPVVKKVDKRVVRQFMGRQVENLHKLVSCSIVHSPSVSSY